MYDVFTNTSKPLKITQNVGKYIPYIECLGIDVRYTPPKINYWNLFTWFEDSKYYRLKSPPKEKLQNFQVLNV